MSSPPKNTEGARRRRAPERIAGFTTRRPRVIAGAWIVIVVVLSLLGRNLDEEVSVHLQYVDGTATKRAHDLAVRKFGGEDATIVLLRGPDQEIEQQGPILSRRLAALPGTLVVSPWMSGSEVPGLRPSPRAGALIVRTERLEDRAATDVLPPIEQTMDRTVTGQVQASVIGAPSTIESFQNASSNAVALGELIALPVLLLVLLVVFRSVIAALLPVLMGATVVAMTRGVLSLINGPIEIDAVSLAPVGMIGLALGVDYSLLVVSRYREERRGDDFAAAAKQTTLATARSIVPAGCGLLLAALVAPQFIPGSGIVSAAIAVSITILFCVASALFVIPALLVLLGGNLDRWTLPRRRAAPITTFLWSNRLAKSPLMTLSIVLVLLVCAGLAFGLKSDMSAIDLLPASDSGRQQHDDVAQALGPGWLAPMEVVVNGRGSPVVSPDRMRSLVAFQKRVERDPGVEGMVGPSVLAQSTNQLNGFEEALAGQERGLARLSDGVARAHGGATRNTAGLLGAADGAAKLGFGVDATETGAGYLASGLATVTDGSSRLADGLSEASQGSDRLAVGAKDASSGIERVADGLRQAEKQADELAESSQLLENAMHSGEERLDELSDPLQVAEGQLRAAWAALQRMSTGRSDPEYAAAVAAVEEVERHLSGNDPRTEERFDPKFDGLGAGIERAEGQFELGLYLVDQMDQNNTEARDGLGELATASRKLDRGISRLGASSRQLADGVSDLSEGGAALSPPLRRLAEGATSLADGLDHLGSGVRQLSSGLDGGAAQSRQLAYGLRTMKSRLRSQGPETSQIDRLRDQSPGLFRSGHFYLAALDGSTPKRRELTNFLVNVNRGGLAARMMVVPTSGIASDQTRATKDRLQDQAANLARQTGTEVAVGGFAANNIEVNDALRKDSLLLRLALALITIVVLVPVMRSLTMPLIAAVLNLITVSATFGLLALLFNGSALGGPGYIDAAIIPMAVMIIFGLAIDYEVFIFARMREEYERTGSSTAAVENGLRFTAPVVTGAAVIMIAVFLAFSVSSFMTLRNFGVAQAIAVFIDAFIIRLVVVPAVMMALGEKSWWMPRWLDRLVPGG